MEEKKQEVSTPQFYGPLVDYSAYPKGINIAVFPSKGKGKWANRRDFSSRLMDYLQEDILQRQHRYREIAKNHKVSLPGDYKAVKVRIVTRLYFKELMDLQSLDSKKIGKLAGADVMLNFSWKLQQMEKAGSKEDRKNLFRLSATVRLIEVATARVLSTKTVTSRSFPVIPGKIMSDQLPDLKFTGDSEGVLKELAHKIARVFYPLVVRGKSDPRLRQGDPLKGDLTWEE